MKRAPCKIIIIIFLTIGRSYADMEDWTNQASVVCPTIGDSNKVLIMVPGNKSGKKSSGKFYDIDIDGKLTVRWEIDWYSDASHVFISGDSLVRTRHIIRKDDESLKELGERPILEFYQKGILIKSYTVSQVGDIGENFGKTSFSPVYLVFASHDHFVPKIVTQLENEVNTIEQYKIVEKKAIDLEDIFKVDVIGGDRIFFRISTGEMLYRFKYEYTNTSVFR